MEIKTGDIFENKNGIENGQNISKNDKKWPFFRVF
jgi:hypothetical protein